MSFRSNSPLLPFVPLSLDARRDAPCVIPRRIDTCARSTFAPLSSSSSSLSSQRRTRDRPPRDRVSRLFPSIYWRKYGGKYSKICTAEVHNVRYEMECLSLSLFSSLCKLSSVTPASRIAPPCLLFLFPVERISRINLTRYAPHFLRILRVPLSSSREDTRGKRAGKVRKLETKEDRELLPLSREWRRKRGRKREI